MSCGAFGIGRGGSCGGGAGAAAAPASGGCQMPRRCADRGFFDPFCMPVEKPRFEPSCYFNPFVHAQCLGVDMNMQGFRNDILKCQEDYKKAVWAVLKKYAVGGDGNKEANASNSFMRTSNENNRMNQAFNNFNMNNMRRSSSIPMDPSMFLVEDPRSLRIAQRPAVPNASGLKL